MGLVLLQQEKLLLKFQKNAKLEVGKTKRVLKSAESDDTYRVTITVQRNEL